MLTIAYSYSSATDIRGIRVEPTSTGFQVRYKEDDKPVVYPGLITLIESSKVVLKVILI